MLRKQKREMHPAHDPIWYVFDGMGLFNVDSSLKISLLDSIRINTNTIGAAKTKQQPNIVMYPNVTTISIYSSKISMSSFSTSSSS